ncbi:MAG TPA: hypothetical protein H9910_06975 [Candidatus Mediterraneibacter quadrami]|uniref:Uncharacterized protein n=1 Tax=Candidatus Mediterraneibacter quadrami TaxID=2838684 RepID=A0A9D2U688_9FIRM|nr:hypothetical protein [Candidatus Mediterraneibacter quadrami]
MSQEKVDRYKQEKANRKKIMHKQRMMGVLRKCVLSLAGLALVAWLGFSAYDMYESGKERIVVETDYTPITDYMDSLVANAAE